MNKVVRSCFYCNIWNPCKRNKKINFLILNCSLLGLPPGFLDLSPVLLILPWLYTSKGELFFLMWLLGDCKRQSSPWAEWGESQCCCTVEFGREGVEQERFCLGVAESPAEGTAWCLFLLCLRPLWVMCCFIHRDRSWIFRMWSTDFNTNFFCWPSSHNCSLFTSFVMMLLL